MATPRNPRPYARRVSAVGTCVALMLTVAACGGGGGGGSDGPGSKHLDLVIGNVLPLSGPSKRLGESGEKASELALDRINDAIKDSDVDHTARTIDQDEGPDAASAKEATKELADEGAGCLTGPWSAAAVEQTGDDIAIPGKILEIAPVPATEEVTELSDHDLVNSTALPVSLEGSALAEAIEDDLGAAEGQTVNIAATNDTYATTLSQDFILAWQDRDGTLGSQVALPPPDSTSSSASSAQASQIASGSPDAVVLIDDAGGFIQLAPSLSSSYSWDPETAWGSDQLASPGLPAEVGDSIAGMRVLAPGSPKGESATTAFVQDFKSAEPHDVKLAPYAAQEFDATVLCYLAAVAAGSTDGQQMADELVDITAPGGDEYTWQQLPDAIEALENGEDIDYTGASGPIDMDVHGNPTSGVFDVYRYTAGGLEVAGEVPSEKPNPATP